MRCDYCNTVTETTHSSCPNCNYPLQGSAVEQSAFRMKLVDVKFWIEGLESPRNLARILGALFLIAGALLLVTLFEYYALGAVTCLVIGGIYIGVFFWSLKDNYTPFLFLPVFYAIHTLIELYLDLLPYNLLPISVENGWIGAIPILVSLLPYIYAAFRILLIMVFIKGLINARKINSSPKLVEQFMKRK